MNEKKITLHAVDYVEKLELYARSRKDEDKKVANAALTALCQCVRKERENENG